MKTFLALLLFMCFIFPLHAQDSADQIPTSLVNKFRQRQSLFNQTEIFLHIDKSIYVNNENIWFKAYVLQTPAALTLLHTLFVFVSERNSGKVILSDKFFMENGMAAGALFIPDSMKSGDYNLIAYTNTFSSEAHPILFQQKISIRNDAAVRYTSSFDNALVPPSADSLNFIYKIRNSQKLYPRNAIVLYKIFSDDSLICNGQKTVNDYGETTISLPVTAASGALNFESFIINDKDSFYFGRRPLSIFDNKIKIRFYPESGELVENLNTRVAFEATTLSGKPVAVTGSVYEGNSNVAKFRANTAGLGIFYLKAKADKKYSFHLNDEKNILQDADLPTAKKIGYNLSVKNGVATDTITADIQASSSRAANVHLLIHDYKNLLGYYHLTIHDGFLSFNIPLGEMPPGLLTLTLLDSLEAPVAERCILVGMNQIPQMTIQTDSTTYHKRSKAELKIFTKDKAGNLIQGAYSLACVYRKRIDTAAYQNIVPYSIFNSYIQHGIIDKIGMYGTGTKEDLETLLLTRCPPKHKEPETNLSVAKYAGGAILDATGYVLYLNRNVKSPVKLTIIGSSGMNEVYSDNRGFFRIPPEFLTAKADEKINIVAGENDKGYTVLFHHFTDSLQDKIAGLHFADLLQSRSALLPEDERISAKEKTLETVSVKTKTLEEAVVSTKSFNAVFKSRNCNDWVCMYNILNCKNHPNGTKPEDGQYYYYKGDLVMYKACKAESGTFSGSSKDPQEIFAKLRGRYYSKEFYKADYKAYIAPDPELQTTVYWQPEVITNSAGVSNVSFYTNDLPGYFLIIVQGITDKGVVSSSTVIKVIE